jgi:hypothetical protein
MLSFKSILFAILAMEPLYAHAHMILKSPVPFGVQTKNPLAEDGSDYPTKGIALTVNTMNEWAVGSKQELSFHGTAVHGGGSCQIALTTDKTPTKDSKFKVIHSFEGGCPASAPGNFDEALVDPAPALSFEVPAEVPAAEYVGAWTWLNKIGNREFYMALYPVTVTGGSADAAAFDALPNMAVANIVGVGGTCKTGEGKDYEFPNPGKYVTKAGTGPFAPLCAKGALAAGKGAPSGGASGGGSGSEIQSPAADPVSSAASVSSQAQATPVSSQTPAASSAYSIPSTLLIVGTVTAPMPSATTTMSPSAHLRPTPIASASASGAPAPQPSAAPNNGNGTSCSPDGSIVCLADGTQFGICNFGKAVMMPVAQGTQCINGAIARRGEYSHRNQRTAV